MTKPFTEFDLADQLTNDRTWRIREISDLQTAVGRADLISQRVLLRASVAICYAHWEGYVRFAARKYLEHIALRRFPYKELNKQFLRNYLLPRLGVISSRRSLADRCALIDEVFDANDLRFSRVNEDLVNTQSNLNFDVFCDICLVCGASIEPYKRHQSFIDVLLLKRRNSIAHGEDTFVELGDSKLIADSVIELIRCFGDELENRAVLKMYRVLPYDA